jgi:hypothetical protein
MTKMGKMDPKNGRKTKNRPKIRQKLENDARQIRSLKPLAKMEPALRHILPLPLTPDFPSTATSKT